MFHVPVGRFQLELNYLYYLFFHRRPGSREEEEDGLRGRHRRIWSPAPSPYRNAEVATTSSEPQHQKQIQPSGEEVEEGLRGRHRRIWSLIPFPLP